MSSILHDNAIVPEFIINPTNRAIFENAGVVEVCVSSESLFERNVIVTAETGPKVGAVNQATGKYIIVKLWSIMVILSHTIEIIRNVSFSLIPCSGF